MAAFKTKANVAENGTVTVAGLPFKTGEQVEVTIEPLKEQKEVKDQFPLRGKPYKYDRPFDGVALDDWGVQE